MSEKHLFPGKTVNFILGTKVVSSLFSDYIGELTAVNTNWTTTYASDLATRVDNIAASYLGVNVRDSLFASSKKLTESIGAARDCLVTLRKNIESDFKRSAEYKTILKDLGLDFAGVYELTQPEFITVLTKFKRGLTSEYKAKITAGGMPASIPDNLAELATTITNLNNDQEKLKNSVKDATGNMLNELNDLYTEIIKICKLASDHYKKDAAKKSMFTFSAILKNQGESKTQKVTEKKVKAA